MDSYVTIDAVNVFVQPWASSVINHGASRRSEAFKSYQTPFSYPFSDFSISHHLLFMLIK
jgi:hypothetical protein